MDKNKLASDTLALLTALDCVIEEDGLGGVVVTSPTPEAASLALAKYGHIIESCGKELAQLVAASKRTAAVGRTSLVGRTVVLSSGRTAPLVPGVEYVASVPNGSIV